MIAWIAYGCALLATITFVRYFLWIERRWRKHDQVQDVG